MSLRRISTGRVVLNQGLIFFTAHFIASQRIRFSYKRRSYEQLRAQLDRDGVARVGRSHDNRVLWWTKPARNVDALYWAPAEMTGEEVALVIWERNQRELIEDLGGSDCTDTAYQIAGRFARPVNTIHDVLDRAQRSGLLGPGWGRSNGPSTAQGGSHRAASGVRGCSFRNAF